MKGKRHYRRYDDYTRAEIDLHLMTFMGLPSSDESRKVTFCSILGSLHYQLSTGGKDGGCVQRVTPLVIKFLIVIEKFSKLVQFPEEHIDGFINAVALGNVDAMIKVLKSACLSLQS